jgi:hypothetical protein
VIDCHAIGRDQHGLCVRQCFKWAWLPANTKLRSSKCLNNLIEQDHRGVKQRNAVMLGFREFRNAAITIAGIELLHCIRKGQFGLGCLSVQGQAAPEGLERRAWCLGSPWRDQEAFLLVTAICTRAPSNTRAI